MEINKHVCFYEEESPELLNYLKANNIPFNGDNLLVMDIYESDPHWKFIGKCVEEHKLLCLSRACFSKQEVEESKWLRVRSMWLNGYPQPEDGFNYETITYTRKNYCTECGSGLIQTDAFRLKKAPKWGRRHFMMLNWVSDELFVNEIAKAVLEREKITGISFKEVKNKKGDEIYEGVYQLVITNLLEPGCIAEKSSLHEVLLCPKCGVKKFHANGKGKIAFRRSIFDSAPDIVKTGDLFGWGHAAPREIIVRQNVYQTIMKHDIGRGLDFEPIDLYNQ